MPVILRTVLYDTIWKSWDTRNSVLVEVKNVDWHAQTKPVSIELSYFHIELSYFHSICSWKFSRTIKEVLDSIVKKIKLRFHTHSSRNQTVDSMKQAHSLSVKKSKLHSRPEERCITLVYKNHPETKCVSILSVNMSKSSWMYNFICICFFEIHAFLNFYETCIFTSWISLVQ